MTFLLSLGQLYSVTLDGVHQPGLSAAANVDQFDSLLFTASSLNTGQEHQVVFGNVPGSSRDSPTDIDYMVITAGNGNDQCVFSVEHSIIVPTAH